MDGLLSTLGLARPRSILRGRSRRGSSSLSSPPTPVPGQAQAQGQGPSTPTSASASSVVVRDVVIKLLVVGDESVGKSSLVAAFERAAPGTGSGAGSSGGSSSAGDDKVTVTPTVGVTVTRVGLDAAVFVELWEVPIQELRADVASHRKLWFDGLNGAVLVFDASRPASMEAVDDWRDALADLPASQIALFLVAHKWESDSTGLLPVDLDAYCAAAGMHGWKTTTMRGESGMRACGAAVAEAATAAVGRARAAGLSLGSAPHPSSSPRNGSGGAAFGGGGFGATPTPPSVPIPPLSSLGVRLADVDGSVSALRVPTHKANTFAMGAWHRSQASSASDLVPSISRMLGYESSTPRRRSTSSAGDPAASPVQTAAPPSLAPVVAVLPNAPPPGVPSEAIHGLCPQLLPSIAPAIDVGCDGGTASEHGVFGPQPPPPFLSPLLTLPDGSAGPPSSTHCQSAVDALTGWSDKYFGHVRATVRASSACSADSAQGLLDLMDAKEQDVATMIQRFGPSTDPSTRLSWLEEVRRRCIAIQTSCFDTLHQSIGGVGAATAAARTTPADVEDDDGREEEKE